MTVDDALICADLDDSDSAHRVLAQEVERVREPKLARHQPCGCVLCRCDDPARCHGCGAKNCGTHPPGEFPQPTVYARYIQIGDVDSPVPTITTSAAYCPECERKGTR